MNRRQFLIAVGAVAAAHALPVTEAKETVRLLDLPEYRYTSDGRRWTVEVHTKQNDVEWLEQHKAVGCVNPERITIDGRVYKPGVVRYDGMEVKQHHTHYSCIYRFTVDPGGFITAAVIDMTTGKTTTFCDIRKAQPKGLPKI